MWGLGPIGGQFLRFFELFKEGVGSIRKVWPEVVLDVRERWYLWVYEVDRFLD